MKFLSLAVALVLVTIQVAGVFAQEEEPSECVNDIVCTFNYDPLCGELNGVETWFSNECMMNSENACKPIEEQHVPCTSGAILPPGLLNPKGDEEKPKPEDE
ncbi:uncharacterized protein LOC129913865 [Episyrphus balteatus]|uniref:uncharacterized protein LOC129913865 n=1 Tax=Episyrphus balteatus TaxID=286459 RepID=UPI002485D3EB|nr:uncharacterized protein LOC129913865 [Episyrphus balteatus]